MSMLSGEGGGAEVFARPLAEGLQAIATTPVPPGAAYKTFMEWNRQHGYFGFATRHEDDVTRLPSWRKGLYVSTAITSGGAALNPDLSFGEIVAENTLLAEELTTQIVTDHGFDARDVLLSTDLPKVEGWKQSDYLIFWLMCLEGVPLDICKPFAAELQRRAKSTRIDDATAHYEEKWPGYQQLVQDFWDLGKGYMLYSNSDYNRPVAGIQQLVQLVDTDRSLGCRAEALYARMRGKKVSTFELYPPGLDPKLGDHIGDLAARGAVIGRLARATRLVPAQDQV